MATKMTWVSIPTKNVRLSIPNHAVNNQAVRDFASDIEEVENFLLEFSRIADLSYGAFIVENGQKGSDIIYEKMYEVYDMLRPTLDHFTEISQRFTNIAESLERSKIKQLCEQKRSEINTRITNLASTCNGDERNMDASGKELLNSLREDARIITKAEDGGYDG